MEKKELISIDTPYSSINEILDYLERYNIEIIECIHENSFLNTKIFHAVKRNGLISRNICLKVIFADKTQEKQYSEKFVLLKENFGTHKNLIQILGIIQFNFTDVSAFVLEYEWLKSSKELFDEIRDNKKLLEKNTIKMIKDISEGIEKLHRSGFTHNDIKVSNVLYKSSPTAECGKTFILSDLDTVTSNENCEQISASNGYSSPEIYALSKTNLDRDSIAGIDRKKCDIYSLGIVIYKLYNKNLFPYQHSADDDSFLEKLNSSDRGYFPDNENIPSEVMSIINKACQFNPDDRFSDISKMAHAFQNVTSNSADEEETFVSNVKPYKKDDEESTKNYHVSDFVGNYPNENKNDTEYRKKKKNSYAFVFPIFIISIVIIAVAVYAGAIFFISGSEKEETEPEITTSSFEDTIKEFVSEIDSVAEKEGYEEALRLVNSFLSTYPYSDELIVKKHEFTKILDEKKKSASLTEADELMNEGKYLDAVKVLDLLTEEIGEDSDVSDKRSSCEDSYVTIMLEKAEERASSLEFDEADSIITEALEGFPENKLLIERKKGIESEKQAYEYSVLKQDVLKRAEEEFNEKNYDKAIEILSSESILADDEDIISAINKNESYKPVGLCNFPIYDKTENKVFNNTTLTDQRENTYYNALSLVGSQSGEIFSSVKSRIEYYIGGDYNRFTCEIVPEESFSKSESVYAIIEIYADDKLIYTSDRITSKTEYIKVSADITGCDYLTFKLATPKNKHIIESQPIDCGIVNAYISRTP